MLSLSRAFDVIEYFSVGKAAYGDCKLYPQAGWEAVIKEYPVDGRAEGLKAYCPVSVVILDVGELGLAVELRIDGETIRAPGGDLKDIYFRRVLTMR